MFYFSEDSENYIKVENIICMSSSYRQNRDVLKLRVKELILLQDEIQPKQVMSSLLHPVKDLNQGPHWWEASALTTLPPLFPNRF